MGSSIADQFSRLFKIDSIDRKILLIIGISAGFSSVFGTPLAGTVFALEVLIIGRMRYEAILPSLITAIIANYACTWWGVGHTQYSIPVVPEMELDLILWSILAGVIFGLSAMLFSKGTHFFGNQFKKFIKYPPLRPVVGGLILATAFWAIGTSKYMGLGVPIIEEAFTHNMEWYDFLAKILFTTFTLGAGFKGGEVTPLFYIGAVLGSALALILPLPVALLAGMGFVGVFSGATNTPIACTLMGIELFGIEAGMFIAIACFTAYLFSGHSSIYGSQVVGSPKSDKLLNEKGEILSDL